MTAAPTSSAAPPAVATGTATAGTATRRVPMPVYLLLGITFGLLLSRAGATTYHYYASLFLFTDLQLMWVIGAGAVTGGLVIAGMRRAHLRVLLTGAPIEPEAKPMRRELLVGSLMLGLGWGLAGACPGTVLVMAGEGKTTALATIGGIWLGTWAYGLLDRRRAVRRVAS